MGRRFLTVSPVHVHLSLSLYLSRTHTHTQARAQAKECAPNLHLLPLFKNLTNGLEGWRQKESINECPSSGWAPCSGGEDILGAPEEFKQKTHTRRLPREGRENNPSCSRCSSPAADDRSTGREWRNSLTRRAQLVSGRGPTRCPTRTLINPVSVPAAPCVLFGYVNAERADGTVKARRWMQPACVRTFGTE